MNLSESKNGENYTYTLSGKFTFADNGAFKDVVDNIKLGKAKAMTLDMAGIEFIDSAGLGMLLVLREEAEKANANLVLRSVNGQVLKMFKVSKFETLFKMQ